MKPTMGVAIIGGGLFVKESHLVFQDPPFYPQRHLDI